ncbi:MAG: EAL domain-containing protein [Actinomycetota bacterium]
MPLTRKLFLGVIAVLLPVAVVVTATISEATNRLEDAARSGLEESGRLEAARINDRLDQIDDDLNLIASSTELRSALESGASAEVIEERTVSSVAEARSVGSGIRSLAIFTPEDGLLAASERLPEIDAALVEAARTETTYGPARRVTDSDSRLLVACSLDREADSGIVLVAEFDLAPFVTLVKAHEGIGESSEAHLAQNVDGAAQFITDPRFVDDFEFAFTRTVSPEQEGMPIIESLSSPETMVISADDYRDEPTLAAVTTIERTGWGLVVKIDESEALAAVDSVSRLLGTGLLVAIAGALLVAWWMVRRLRARVETVTDAALAIGAGDLDRRIGPSGDDEIGRIAEAIDQMASDLGADRRRREEAEAVLNHQARHDPLTGLPNRASALGAIHAALHETGPRTTLLFLDLDGFKTVNDRYGHDSGDQLLVTVADRLRRTVPPELTVARFGGDEFLVVTTEDDAACLADHVRQALRRPIDIGVAVVETDVSIGVATAAEGHTADLLIRDADLAMYQAKQDRRRSRTNDELEMDGPTVDELRAALADEQLSVAFQPIVDLDLDRIIGVEALARWDHPRLGPVPADRWIPLARAAGLLGQVDRHNISHAIRELARWRAEGRVDRDFVMSVNLASESVPVVIDRLGEELLGHGVPPHQLQIEITEEDFGDRREHVERRLWSLHRLGARLAIDDFGVVHSNLDRLRRLPVSTIKIDQSFVRDLPRSDADRAIIRAVMAMATELGISVVAEGVEDESQAGELRGLGCRFAQGFHLGLPAEAPQLSTVG